MSISDLVARLRDLVVETKHGKGVRASIAAEDVLEAAAEIERLRAEVARLVKSRNKWGQKYNQTLEKLKLAVWTDTEEVKAANEACVEFKQRAEAAEARLAEAVALLIAWDNDYPHDINDALDDCAEKTSAFLDKLGAR